MNKRKLTTKLLCAGIAGAVILITNIIIFSIIGKYVKDMMQSFWVGYAFFMFGFVMLGGYQAIIKSKEIALLNFKLPTLAVVSGYVVINTIINIASMAVNNEASYIGFMIFDFIWLLLVVALLMVVILGFKQISDQEQEVKENVGQLNNWNYLVTSCVIDAKSDDLKVKLNELLEVVKYSDPMSMEFPDVAIEDKKVTDKLQNLCASIGNVSDEEMLELIDDAQRCLNKRNTLLKLKKS